jgi:hypothetical protein
LEGKDLSSLKILGTVGEPINEEAWHWYDEHIGKRRCPIVDTWWQTETGGIMISNLAGITPAKPSYATLPLPGIQPVLVDEQGKEITGSERTMIDTQQQSFFGIMNIIRSKKRPIILDPKNYFICPNWGYHPIYGQLNPENEFEGWDINMKSKIVHFIGHTVLEGVYYGKPKLYNKLVDDYLKKQNII